MFLRAIADAADDWPHLHRRRLDLVVSADGLCTRHQGCRRTAGPFADAFFVAFRLPNHFRAIFAEGAFNAVFVPAYARIRAASGPDQAVSPTVTLLLLASQVLLLVLCARIHPWQDRASRWDFPTTPRASRRPSTPRASPSVPAADNAGNALRRHSQRVHRLVMGSGGAHPSQPGHDGDIGLPGALRCRGQHRAAAWGADLGRSSSCWSAATRQGNGVMPISGRMEYRRRCPSRRLGPPPSPGRRSDCVICRHHHRELPVRLAALSALYYADRINQLPIGAIGIAAGIVVLPEMAARIAQGDEAGAKQARSRRLTSTLLFSIPCLASPSGRSQPLYSMRALFMHGAFTANDAGKRCRSALAAYALGLLPFVLIRSVTASFLARGNTATPVRAVDTRRRRQCRMQGGVLLQDVAGASRASWRPHRFLAHFGLVLWLAARRAFPIWTPVRLLVCWPAVAGRASADAISARGPAAALFSPRSTRRGSHARGACDHRRLRLWRHGAGVIWTTMAGYMALPRAARRRGLNLHPAAKACFWREGRGGIRACVSASPKH